ncbi:MAG: O-antigen ligase domain-containing protein [Rhodospirillaceae bacterium]|nr:O-antigen ligase domain-containing protein [Rhodospirillaceae bacterium]
MTSHDADDQAVAERRRPLIRRLADNLVVALFFAPVMLAALPMGANRDWAWAPIAIMIGLVAVLVAAGFGAGRGFEVGERERRPLLALIGCFVFVVAFALLQGASFAPASGSAWLYASALRILGSAHAAVPDIALDTARNGLLKCITCGLIFVMARTICRDRGHARLLLALLVASTVLVVVYGLIMHVTTHGCYVGTYLKKYGFYDPRGQCLMSGSFVNSNSFACYVGMGVVAAMALALTNRRRERSAFDGRDIQTFESVMTATRVALVVAIFFLLGGLLMSASRAGVAASVAGALALALLLMRGQWHERPDLVRWFWIAAAIVFVVGVIAGGALLSKSVRAGDGGSRLIIWMTSLDAIGLSPWLGWGLGSFGDIYTILQPASIIQPNDLAHSTPIETIVELGVIAAIPAFAVVLMPWGFSLRAAFRQQYRYRVLPAAAFAIAAVPILHSMVDFSLQIPAVGFVTSAVLGMGWAQAFDRRRSQGRSATV